MSDSVGVLQITWILLVNYGIFDISVFRGALNSQLSWEILILYLLVSINFKVYFMAHFLRYQMACHRWGIRLHFFSFFLRCSWKKLIKNAHSWKLWMTKEEIHGLPIQIKPNKMCDTIKKQQLGHDNKTCLSLLFWNPNRKTRQPNNSTYYYRHSCSAIPGELIDFVATNGDIIKMQFNLIE